MDGHRKGRRNRETFEQMKGKDRGAGVIEEQTNSGIEKRGAEG